MDTVNSNTEAFKGRLSLFLSVALGILLSGCVTDARIPQIVFNTSVDDNCPVPEPNGGDDKFIHVKLYFQGDCPVKPDLDCVTVSQETGFKQKIRWQAYDLRSGRIKAH